MYFRGFCFLFKDRVNKNETVTKGLIFENRIKMSIKKLIYKCPNMQK